MLSMMSTLLRCSVRPALLAVGLLVVLDVFAAGKMMLYVYQLPDGTRMVSNYVLNNPQYRLVRVGEHLGRDGQLEASRHPGFFRTDPNAYDHLIREAAREHKLDFALLKAIMHVESAFNPYAKSNKGALGLMQLMPDTARRYGVAPHDVYEPRQNIQGAARYLKFLTSQFRDIRHVIAAYNAGENAVSSYRGIPPYNETVNYVAKVLRQKQRYSRTS